MTVASRVAVMDEGRLCQVATPDQIYEAPNSVYVADFIGDVNVLSGVIKQVGDDRFALQLQDVEPPIVSFSDKVFKNGSTAHLAIRPEKISIDEAAPKGADNAVRGKVHDIAYLGNLSTYHVEIPGGQIIKAQTANTQRIEKRSITWEDQVWLSWSASAGVLLEQ